MMTRRLCVVGAAMILSAIAGCAATGAHRGRVVQPQVGSRYMDFSYVDDQGRSHRLSEHLGDYTLLVFTECGGSLHGPVSEQLEELVQVTEDPGIARTIGFDIHWSEDGCHQGKSCHLLAQNADLYSICDGHGKVSDLYAVTGKNKVFVIGPEGGIIDSARAGKLSELKARFKRIVRDYAAEKRERMPQEM